jgi:hypothetical protein
MSSDTLFPLPEPGRAFLLPTGVFAAFGGSPQVSGLAVSHDGRITLAINGGGLAVQLDPEQCMALGAVLWALGERLSGEQPKADTPPLHNIAVVGTA